MRNRLALVCAILLMFSTSAGADSFVVRSGALDFDHEGHGFVFRGDGFSAGIDFFDNIGLSFGPEPGCDPCRGGEAYDASFSTTNTFMGTGTAIIGEDILSDVSFFGDLSFSAAPYVLVETVELGSEMATPFTFIGTLRGFRDGQLAFTAALTGGGLATRFFDFEPERNLFFAGENRLTYFFSEAAAPTPEPASLLLLGTGIAGILARRARLNRRAG